MEAAEGAQAGARSRAEEFALEEVYSDRLSDFYDAVKRLLRTPAPDVAALAVKIRYAVDHEVTTLPGGPRCMAAVKADAMRIGAQWALGTLPGPHPELFAPARNGFSTSLEANGEAVR